MLTVHDGKVTALVVSAPLEVPEAVPGAGMLGAGLDAGKEALTSSLIEDAVKDPVLHTVPVPQPDQMAAVKHDQLVTQVLRAYDQQGQLPVGLRDVDGPVEFGAGMQADVGPVAASFLHSHGWNNWLEDYANAYQNGLNDIPRTGDALISLLGGGFTPKSEK